MPRNPYEFMYPIEQSNIPKAEKSAIRSFFDKLTGGESTGTGIVVAPQEETGIIRQTLVSGGTGAILAGMQAHLPKGLDSTAVPADAAAGIVGMLASLGNHSFKEDAKAAGHVGIGIFAFRKTLGLLGEKELASKGSSIHGEETDIGEDPIEACAKNLKL